MGNCLGGISKRERRHIKIKKVDGTVMNLRSPACVKEVVCDYPDHGVFVAGSVCRPTDLGRPLPHSAELRTGDLYLLIPLVASPVSAENEGFLCKEEMVDKLKSSIVQSRIVSACENGSTVRVTIRLRKKEAAFLAGNDGQEAMKKLLASFSWSTMEMQRQRFSEWKPRLEPISEDLTSVLHQSTATGA